MKKIIILALLVAVLTTPVFANLLIGATTGFDFFFSSFGDNLNFIDYDLPIFSSISYFFGEKQNFGLYLDTGISIGIDSKNIGEGTTARTNIKDALTFGVAYKSTKKNNISFVGNLGLQVYTDYEYHEEGEQVTINLECSLKTMVMFDLKNNLKLLAGLRGTLSFDEYYNGYEITDSRREPFSSNAIDFFGLGIAPLISFCVEI